MPAKMEDARLRQRVVRLLRALPLVTVVLLIAGPPLKAEPQAGPELPKGQVEKRAELQPQKTPEQKRRGPKL
jgi:cell filamentation protein